MVEVAEILVIHLLLHQKKLILLKLLLMLLHLHVHLKVLIVIETIFTTYTCVAEHLLIWRQLNGILLCLRRLLDFDRANFGIVLTFIFFTLILLDNFLNFL